MSFADICLQLFDFEVPQKIGGTLPGEADDLTVVPLISYAEANYTCERVFCHEVFSSLEDHVNFLFANKRQWIDRQAISDHDKTRHHNILSMLQSRASSAMRSISPPSLRRCVLCHDDMNNQNILIQSDGRISAVIDWELHLLQPAILVASSPPWLVYDGPLSPEFAWEGIIWLDSPAEGARLNSVFEEVRDDYIFQSYGLTDVSITVRAIQEWGLLRSFGKGEGIASYRRLAKRCLPCHDGTFMPLVRLQIWRVRHT